MTWTRSWSLGLLLALGPSPARAMAGAGLRAVRADPAAVAGVRAELSERCAEQVRAELVAGRRADEGCAQDREAAGRVLVRRRDAFGFVEWRDVDLTALRLVLGVGQRCRQWPLRSPAREVLRRTDVDAAGCRLRRYQGEVPLVFVDREGGRHEPLPPLRSDRDGRVALEFATLDRGLRALGAGTLDGYARIELGEAGWAGHVDLEPLLRLRADGYLTWLRRGLGTPGLFVVRHPDHPGAAEARMLASEAYLARQAQDLERVEAGELPARAFLERYPRSPYRRRVEALLRERAQSAGAGSGGGTASPSGAGRRGGAAAGSGP